jgi:hypothetical protein
VLERSHPRSSRGVSGDDPEGGAGSGVLRRRLVTAGPGRPGTPPARHYDLAARSSLHGSARQLPAVVGRRAPKETEARPRGPKPPRWSAERRASRVMGRKAPRKRLACRVMACPTGVPPSTRTFLGAPPTPRFGVSEAKLQTPGAEMRRGNEMVRLRQGYGGLDHWPAGASAKAGGLFDIVSWTEMRCRPHPEERACASASAESNARARVLKDEGAGAKHQPAGVRNDRRGTFIVSGLLFTMTFATPTCRPHRALKILQGNTRADVPLKPPSHSNFSSIARRFAVVSRGVCWCAWCAAKRTAPAGRKALLRAIAVGQFDSHPRSLAGSLRHGCGLIGVILS